MLAPADYVLRPLTAEDEELLWGMLYQALQPESGEALALDIVHRPEYGRFVDHWGRSGDLGFLALDKGEGTLLGAVWLRGGMAGDPQGGPPELAFVVKPGHRHRGIGASLLTQLVRNNPDLTAVALRVGAHSPAVRLFERFGFEIATQGEKNVVMRRPI